MKNTTGCLYEMYARGLVYVLYECLLVGYDVNIYIVECLVLCSTIVHGLVTWLILPVVIRLSQRLSHACLSINNLYCETANGSLYQL